MKIRAAVYAFTVPAGVQLSGPLAGARAGDIVVYRPEHPTATLSLVRRIRPEDSAAGLAQLGQLERVDLEEGAPAAPRPSPVGLPILAANADAALRNLLASVGCTPRRRRRS